MQTIQLQYPLKDREASERRQVLAIGDFDGVHLGHREVINRAVRRGSELGVQTAIMTFNPHPRQVLGMDKYAQLLTPQATKQAQLEQLHVDTTYIVDFNESFMRLTPDHFVEEMLIPLKVDTVFVGFDFTFGHKGAGTPDTLCELAKARFTVEVVRPCHLNGQKISSTLVRERLLNGEVREAKALLGRPYMLRGKVIHGDARGRTIGFPTANIDVSEPFLIPRNGVYTVEANVSGATFGGVMNIGMKPTFDSGQLQPTLEAHLFDFSGDIYGEQIEVELVSYIREERKFASIQELISQIGRDADQARSILIEKRSLPSY